MPDTHVTGEQRRTFATIAADLCVPPECRDMIRRGALVAINSSGGKDSQTMTILLARAVPRDQLVVVHAPLGEVEWPGTVEHIENTMPAGVPLILARVASGKSLLELIGIRRDESNARSKRIPWARSDRNSRAGREWFEWLPIFDLTTDDVFRVIRDAGQSPHWVYARGMSRCSCSLCSFFSSKSDIRVRRGKAPSPSGCEPRPATVAPAGSNRSGLWR